MSLRKNKFYYYREYLYLFSRIRKKLSFLRNRWFGLFAGRLRYKLLKEWSGSYNDPPDLSGLLQKKKIQFPWNLREALSVEQQKKIIFAADKILEGYYNLLGSGNTLIVPIDWHTDFKSGFRWTPGKFFMNYNQVDLSDNADIKTVRELSRCHHFLQLGQAWLLTGNKKYSYEYFRQINHWIDNNPFMFSVNWSSTMDVAIRAVNWIYAAAMFTCNQELHRDITDRMVASLFEHGWFIFNNLEKNYIYSNNHYAADIAGLILLGLLFSETDSGQRWLRFGKRELFQEIRRQLLPGGVSYEKSVNYCRLVNEFFTYSVIQLQKNNHYIPPDILYRIEKQFEFVMHYTKPDGLAPVIGDQDNGRLLPFSERDVNDHRYLLTIGSILFKRTDFRLYSPGMVTDALFLFGEKAVRIFDKLGTVNVPELKSRAFMDAGFFIMRNEEIYLFINNSGQGKYSEDPFSFASHTHADLLSFELYTGGRTILVDPGTYLYTSSPEDRYLFRSSAMHNTVTVDNKNQYEFTKNKPFWYDSKAEPKTIGWQSTDDYDCYIGEHNAYARLQDPVIHRRYFLFRKYRHEIKIIDRLTGTEPHDVSLHFHFNSGIDFMINENDVVTRHQGGKNIKLSFTNNQMASFEFIKSASWISPSYGIRNGSLALEVKCSSVKLPLTVETVISLPDE
jgi:hypothetical protein